MYNTGYLKSEATYFNSYYLNDEEILFEFIITRTTR